jgi:hypothetical protein
MHITSSLDWSNVSSQLRKIGKDASSDPRLNRVLTNINNQVKKLGNMEVDARRMKRAPTMQYNELLENVNQSITELEMLLLIAALGK